MALPFKNGADLYNNEVLRMRFHNLGADPTSDFGVGQVYFNTSTSEGSGKRVRIYDGSAFRSLAYFDEFTALQTKVNAFLDGGVDADGVLENLAEIQKFLDNYSSATDLSEILNTKLNKAGGTIGEGGANSFPLTISSTNAYTGIALKMSSGTGWFRFRGGSNWEVTNENWSETYSLLHSGNVGEYKAGDSDKLGGLEASRYFLRNSVITSDTQDADTWGTFGFARLANNGGESLNWPDAYGYILNYKGHESNRAGFQLFAKASGNVLLFRRHWDSWADWKTIAFTDSDITGNVLNSDGDILLTYNDGLFLGYGPATKSKNTIIYGNSVVMRYSSNRTQGFILNSSGNVTIGDSDLASTKYKLALDGGLAIYGTGNANYPSWIRSNATNGLEFILGLDANNNKTGLHIGWRNAEDVAMAVAPSGNVGIGTTNPDEKLHVVGNLHVTGNIIADGEVSAGGAGEEGDAGTGTGGGDALIYAQEFTPTTTSITITHNLSATKGVIVQVWEKNGNYWDMVLVDVEEVDTNTVTLFFGKTETTVHKVVIMG